MHRLLILNISTLIFFLTISCSSLETNEQQSVQDKVVNGQETADNPYVVSLVWGGQSGCTGTLIRDNIVLTAGHCIDSDNSIYPPEWVEVGAIVGQTQNTRSAVAGYQIEPRWNPNLQGNYNYDYDIALIFLETPIRGLAISYSSLSPSSLIGQKIRAIGYGVDNGFQQSGAGVKRTVDLTIRSAEANYFIASWESGQPLDTCQGDSGGPALYLNNGRYEVLGVVSNGPDFCQGSTRYTTASDHTQFLSAAISNFERNGVSSSQEVEDVTSPNNGYQIYTCGQIYQCLQGCSEDNCRRNCINSASPGAQSHFQELNICNDTYQCNADITCLSNSCPTQLVNCDFTPMPSSPNNNQDAITTCAELRACELECEQSNDYDTCVEVCYRSVTDTQAISDLNRLQSCANNSNCSSEECVIETCRSELIACGYEDEQTSSDRTDPPTPNTGASCTDIWNCLTECLDDNCAQACYAIGNQETIYLAESLVICYNTFYESISSIMDLYTYCPNEAAACFE